MTKVLHIIHSLSLGGAARGMIATAKYSAQQGPYQHAVLSLRPAEPAATRLAMEAGLRVIDAPDRGALEAEIVAADIVHFSWWNNPEVYDFLRSELPAMRLMIWPHVAGDGPPQILTRPLVDFADMVVASSPHTYERPVLLNLPPDVRQQKVALVYDAADFARVANPTPKPHAGFNVGYIGTVEFIKMHPDYVPMSAAIAVPGIRFVVCGGGIERQLMQQAASFNAAERFDFRGYVTDIRPVIEVLDVYGYPLCEGNYASAELNLQEVMVTGVPPVVFPYGGVGRLVMHDYTGLIVHSALEYKEAIEYLYHHPEERTRLGRNAREYALQIFGAENAARKINRVYDRMLQTPKRARVWGAESGVSLVDQPLSLKDLLADQEPVRGARAFVESLGDKGEDFQTSLTSSHDSNLLKAELAIAAANPLLASATAGGILHYRNHYPQDAHLRLWSGLVLSRQARYPEAAAEFGAAHELGLTHWRVRWYLAQALKEAGYEDLAVRTAQELARHVPPESDAAGAVCDFLQEAGEYLDALTLLDEAISLRPEDPALLKRRGISLYGIGNTEGAEKTFRQVLQVAPNDTDAIISLADLSLSAQRYESAFEYFECATRMSPTDVEAFVGLALAAQGLRDEATLAKALHEIRALAPDHPSLPGLQR